MKRNSRYISLLVLSGVLVSVAQTATGTTPRAGQKAPEFYISLGQRTDVSGFAEVRPLTLDFPDRAGRSAWQSRRVSQRSVKPIFTSFGVRYPFFDNKFGSLYLGAVVSKAASANVRRQSQKSAVRELPSLLFEVGATAQSSFTYRESSFELVLHQRFASVKLFGLNPWVEIGAGIVRSQVADYDLSLTGQVIYDDPSVRVEPSFTASFGSSRRTTNSAIYSLAVGGELTLSPQHTLEVGYRYSRHKIDSMKTEQSTFDFFGVALLASGSLEATRITEKSCFIRLIWVL